MVMTVSSGLNVRLASLYGSVMRTHLVHAVEHLEQRGSPVASAADGADDRAARAGGPVHVEAHLHQLRDHALNLLFGRALLHHHDHGVLRHSCPSEFTDVLLRRGSPLEPPRLVDDALEQPRDRVVVERARD